MARFRFAGIYLARKDDKLVAVPYADISIYLAGTDTPAIVYTSETGSYYVSSAPQLNTNENGEFEFYVDDTDYDYTQKFKIVCSKPGYETKTWDYVSIFPYAGFDAHSIRDVEVADNLSDVISVHDLLKYQGTQFVSENIDETLKSYYNPLPHHLLKYNGTQFVVEMVDGVLKTYYKPSPNHLLKYQGTRFVTEAIDTILKTYYNPSPHHLLKYDGTRFIREVIGVVLKSYYNPSQTDEIIIYNGTNFVNRFIGDVDAVKNTMEKIAEVNVSSDCDYVDFTNLDGNDDWFYWLLIVIKNPSTTSTHLNLYVNGDTTESNYHYAYLSSGSGGVSGGVENRPSILYLDSGVGALLSIVISKDVDGYFRYMSRGVRKTGSDVVVDIRHGCRDSTISNITSLRIQGLASGMIGVGSKFILFKARRA